eukprot:TRINITY_DN16024_c0_g1_i1.p2 TRINITY_DN16024_c0_g1~~TRINITY_DN16024_c0_g1_i1.p2  ORF type:complete len:155 (+),score=23.84 TRINITY_DN16024_c0_g1_i1:41-466(+)
MAEPHCPADGHCLYELLGLDSSADAAAVDRAYRARALGAHPDRGGDGCLFVRLKRAHEVLSCPRARADYDAQRSAAQTAGGAGDACPLAGLRCEGALRVRDCRCGGRYELSDDDAAAAAADGDPSLLVPCSHCSLEIEVSL